MHKKFEINGTKIKGSFKDYVDDFFRVPTYLPSVDIFTTTYLGLLRV